MIFYVSNVSLNSTVFIDYLKDFCVHTLQDIRVFVSNRYTERGLTRWREDMNFMLQVMSRIERKYCLTSTSYLAELFDIFRLLYV